MTTVNKIIISFLFLALPVFAYASSSAGTTAVPFLKYGAGARAAGMGSAFSAVPGAGSDMIYWNPAGLASSNRKDVSLMYLSGLEGISYGWASYAMPSIHGTFGAAVQYMSSGDIAGTGINGESMSDFSTYDIAVSLSYARYYDFGKAGILDYGANFKYIYSKIDASASAFAVDLGAIFTLSDNVTSFGAVMQNAGSKIKYNEEEELLPFTVRVGASRIFIEKLLVTLDVNFPNDNDVFPSLGAEYKIDIMPDAGIAIRAGYDGRQKDIDGFTGINAGFGLKYKDYIFDYAFSPYGDLGDVHRVSLGITFGKEFDEATALKEHAEKKLEKEKTKKAKEEAEAEKQRQENEQALASMRPEGLDEDFNRMDFGEEFGGQNDNEVPAAVRPVKKNIESVAVIDFVSSSGIPQNELGVYSEMMRKHLFDTGAFSSVDAAKVKDVYSGKQYPANSDLYNVLKFTKAKKIIAGAVSKQGENLTFDLTVYDQKLNGKKYKVVSRDSFRYANDALKELAEKLAEEVK